MIRAQDKIVIFCIYFFNTFSAIRKIPNMLFLAISSILFLIVFQSMKNNYKISATESLLVLMIITLPVSFRNIFGGGFNEMAVSFFHFFSVLFILSSVKLTFRKKISKISVIVLFLLFFNAFQLFVTTNNFETGVKEFMLLIFHLATIGSAYEIFRSKKLKESEVLLFINLYIVGAIFSSIGIIFQYLVYKTTGIKLFFLPIFGSIRIYMGFLFYDMSLMTLYLASAIMINDSLSIYNKFLLRILIILSMALSTARTGLYVYVLYFMWQELKFLFSHKAFSAKNAFILLLTFLIMVVSFQKLKENRYGSEYDFEMLFDSTGRVDGYLKGLKYFASRPIFGQGLDFYYKYQYVNRNIIPHSFFIYLLNQSGVIYFIVFMYLHHLILKNVNSRKLHSSVYFVLFIGSNLVPGFLSGRFFTVMMVLSILLDCDTERGYSPNL